MLLHQKLIHPEINGIIGAAGHHSKILIADGNAASSTWGECRTRFAQPYAGVVTCAQVMDALLSAVPIEAANTMGIPEDDPYASSDRHRSGPSTRNSSTKPA